MVSRFKGWLTAAVLGICMALFVFLYLNASASQPKTDFSQVVVGIGTHGNLSSELRALQSGVRYFRNDITLSQAQISQISNESRDYGASYLGILDYSTLPSNLSKTWNLTDWNASVATALVYYPEVRDWELWNEPWVSAFQTGYMNGSAYNYFQVIRSAYMRIKAAQPNATVVCFGGAPIDYSWFVWYEQVWSYGASNYCDAISVHLYPSLPFNQSERAVWTSYLSAYENMTGKPIWITETGMPASSTVYQQFTPQSQDQFLQQDFEFLSRLQYVKRIYWYDLWGLSDGQYMNDYGLLNLTDPYAGTPNPAWQSFLRIYNGSASR